MHLEKPVRRQEEQQQDAGAHQGLDNPECRQQEQECDTIGITS